MAKGDDGSAPGSNTQMPMGNGLPPSGQGISGYGMNSIMPTLALIQRLQNPGAGMMGNPNTPGMSMGMPSAGINPGQFQQLLNPGFNFNTPISAPPTRDTYGNNIRSPFASFAPPSGQNSGRTNPNPGETIGNAQPRMI